MSIIIRKAERKKAKLRLALIGPTGSGKTYSALQLAAGLGSKIGLIDTENGSGDLYADRLDYDVITLAAPYTVTKYREAIKAFEEAGYEIIIIDSLSHAWAGAGGLLDKQGQLESSGRFKNSFATWREITPEHNKLVEEILGSPCHIIATMRAKTEYVLERDEKGRQIPRKIGLSPVQRDGVEYEFTVVMDVAENHYATASKDRTTLFDGWTDKISRETGKNLLAWLNSGTTPPPSLKDEAGKLAAEVDAAKDVAALERLVADRLGVILRLKDELPTWHERLVAKVEDRRKDLAHEPPPPDEIVWDDPPPEIGEIHEMRAVENSTDSVTVEGSSEHGEVGGATTPTSPTIPAKDTTLVKTAVAIAKQGSETFRKYVAGLAKTTYARIEPYLDELQGIAEDADKELVG